MVSNTDVIKAVVTEMQPRFTRNASSDMVNLGILNNYSPKVIVQSFKEGDVRENRARKGQFKVRGNGIEFIGVPDQGEFVVLTVRNYVDA